MTETLIRTIVTCVVLFALSWALKRFACDSVRTLRQRSVDRHFMYYSTQGDEAREKQLEARQGNHAEGKEIRKCDEIYGQWFMLASAFVPLAWAVRFLGSSKDSLWPIPAELYHAGFMTVCCLYAWQFSRNRMGELDPTNVEPVASRIRQFVGSLLHKDLATSHQRRLSFWVNSAGAFVLLTLLYHVCIQLLPGR